MNIRRLGTVAASCRAAAVAAALAACGLSAGAQEPSASIRNLAGCYAVELGAWSPAGASVTHQPPAMLRLYETQQINLWGGLDSRRLEPSITSGRSRPVQGYWLERGGSVELAWRTDFSGVELVVDAKPDSHRGTARAYHDVVGAVQPTAPVRLRRTACTGALGGSGGEGR